MFSCVVYKLEKGKYKVENTSDGGIDKGVYYKNIEAIPSDIKNKLKQLMWTSPDDQSITDTLGVRIGDRIFWII